MSGKCNVCGSPSTMRCSRCSSVFYCGRDHQMEDWRRGHKKICKSLVSKGSSSSSSQGASKKWKWHILLTRPLNHVNMVGGVPAAVMKRVDTLPGDPTGTMVFGWRIKVYRLEDDLFDNPSFARDDTSRVDPFLPVEFAAKFQKECNKKPGSDHAGLFDFADPNYHNNSLDELVRSPFGCLRLLTFMKRVIMDTNDLIGVKGHPRKMIRLAMEVLGQAKFMGVERVPRGDAEDKMEFNEDIHDYFNETEWVAAAKQCPSDIRLHIPLIDEILSEKDIAKEVQLAFPKANISVNREIALDSNDPEVRLMWGLNFANQMLLRALLRGNGDCTKLEHADNTGAFEFGVNRLYLRGCKLSNVPNSLDSARYRSVYSVASSLLVLRPWGVLAPFEILKVTVSEGGKEVTRWVQFASKEQHGDGSSKSNALFGSAQIQHSFEGLQSSFGRENLLLRSGCADSYAYRERLFVASDPPVSVHYDTIYLLEKLFGNPFGSLPTTEGDAQKAFGWLPSLQVETGRVEHFRTQDALGRSSGSRPLREAEMLLTGKICSALCSFVKDLKENRTSKDEVFERAYPVRFCNKQASVKVTYNMDEENGGIWDRKIKWMWFD